LGNGTHYPILVTMICETTQPPPTGTVYILNYLKNHYHIKARGVHIFGLSEGSFTNGYALGVTDTTGTGMTGADVGMRNITSATFLSGVASSNTGPTPAQYSEFGHWAKVYGGRAFLTVGYDDAQSPYPPLAAIQMQDSVSGSVYFSYNNIGSGTHCCWNTDYDPTLVLWNSVTTPLGTYVTTSTDPNIQGYYSSPASLFQNAMRQGDTTLVTNQTSLTISKVIPMEYWAPMLCTNDTLYALVGSSVTSLPLPSGELAVDAAGCFNFLVAAASDGTLYKSSFYNTNPITWTQVTTDSSGSTINYAHTMYGFQNCYTIIGTDSLLRFTGDDTMHIYHTTGGVLLKTFVMASGVKFRKAVLSARGVVAVTSDSTKVYAWTKGDGSGTPNIYTLTGIGTGKAIDVASSNYNADFVIIQQTAGSAYGHPYVVGNAYGMWGSATTQSFASLSDLYTQWGLTSLVKRIEVNSQTTTIIDSAKVMKATGYNVQGEVGTGVEYVNRYTYSSWPNYGWDFQNYENPVIGMVQIGTNFSDIYSNGFFSFYKYAKDANGNFYAWGRNKTDVQGRGNILNLTDNPNQPNAQDVTSPTLTTPLTQILTTLNWVGPVLTAPKQTIGSTSVTLSTTGHPALLLVAANTSDTVNYTTVSNGWTQVSGPNTATIASPSSRSTTASGLINGTYIFRDTTIDNNGGINQALDTIVVSLTTPPTVNAGSNQNLVSPTTSTTLSGSVTYFNGSTGSSVVWSQVSGPNTAGLSQGGTTTAPTASITGMIVGTYVFKLSVTDSNNNTGSSTVTVVLSAGAPTCSGCILQKIPVYVH
jgi:hypothetical protein